jgi:hypothetical protein
MSEKKPKQQKVVKRNMTEEEVMDINFFKEDIDEMNKQYDETKQLYGEIHDIFAGTCGGDYVPSRNLRDMAELTKSLTTTRSLCVDIVNKRHAMKKNIVDIVSRRKGNDTENDVVAETARRIVECVNAQAVANAVNNTIKLSDGTDYVKPIVNQECNTSDDDSDKLERAISDAIDSGSIVMTKNDRFIAVADHVVPRFDKDANKIVAVDQRNGQVIPDFPEERLPRSEVSSVDSSFVRLKNGENIRYLGEDDDDVFDPDDVED